MSYAWTLTAGVEMDGHTVVWVPNDITIPERCICGYPFKGPPSWPKAEIECVGPWKHRWRALEVELEERIRVRSGQSGRQISELGEGPSTEPGARKPG